MPPAERRPPPKTKETTMSVDALHAALRSKYRTSTDAMLALGLNPALLHERKPMTRRAYDTRPRRVGDAEPMSVPDALEAIRDILANCEDGDALAASIVDELNGGNEIGEPEAGSREAEDRRRRAMGLDARPRPVSASQQRRFDELFPSAARIGFM